MFSFAPPNPNANHAVTKVRALISCMPPRRAHPEWHLRSGRRERRRVDLFYREVIGEGLLVGGMVSEVQDEVVDRRGVGMV